MATYDLKATDGQLSEGLSSARLRELANLGRIGADDEVRRVVSDDEKGEWVRAAQMNDLLTQNPTERQGQQPTPSTEDDAESTELKRLKKLRDDGLINEREYAEKKAEVLGLPFTPDAYFDADFNQPVHDNGAPPIHPPPLPPRDFVKGDATGGLIPYKNVPALLAWYFGVFGLIPFLGFPLAIAAIILGVIGLKRRKAHRVVAGGFHGVAGIVLGAFSVGYHGLIIVLMVVA